MPRNAAARTGPRSALPAPSTGYEIARDVKQTPTDTPVVTAGPSRANDLMQALQVAGKLIPVAAEVGQMVKVDRTKKGMESRFAGDALDPNQSNAFIDGYERMDGQYRGVQFSNAAKEYAATNSHLGPEEFQKGLDALQTEYTGKLIHQGQLDTFLPSALRGGEHAADMYQKAKNAEIIQERNMKTTEIAKNETNVLADSALKEIGIPGGIQQLADNPMLTSTVVANKEKFLGLVGPALRKQLDAMRANYKALGMSTPEISAILLGVVGRLSVQTSTPELMSYAFITDESGMTVSGAFPKEVDEYMSRAAASRKTLTHEAVVLARQQKADATKAYTNGIIFAAAAIPSGDNKAAAAVLESVQSNPLFAEMDSGDVRRLSEDMFNVVNRRGFMKESDPDVYTDLRFRAEMGRATPQEIKDNRKLLSFAHYSELLNTLDQKHTAADAKNTKAKDEMKDAGLDLYRRELASQDKAIESMLNPTGPAGNIIHPENADVHAKARESFGRAVEKALKANGGKREAPEILEAIRAAGKVAVEENWPLVKSTVQGNEVGYYSKNGVKNPLVISQEGTSKAGLQLPSMKNTASGNYVDVLNQGYNK